MCLDATTYVWNTSKLKGSALLLLLAIADYADHDGKAFPAIATLAKKARMSERNVQYLLKTLVKEKVLTVARSGGEKTETGATNAYTLVGFVEWYKGVQRLSSHDDQGVKNRVARGEKSRRQGVQPIAPKQSLEPKEEPKEKESKTMRAKRSAQVVIPFPESDGITHKAKSAMIAAWWDNLPAQPADLDPASIYKIKAHFQYAENLLKQGVTPDSFALYVKAQTGEHGFYRDKPFKLKTAAAGAPAWCKANARQLETALTMQLAPDLKPLAVAAGAEADAFLALPLDERKAQAEAMLRRLSEKWGGKA